MTDERAPDMGTTTEPVATPPPAPVAPPPAPVAPPPAAWAPAPAAVAAGPGQRTVLALIAGIIMVVGGILFGLAGLAVAVIGRAVIDSMGDLGQFPGLDGVDAGALASGIMTFAGILILVFALTYLIGGIGVIRNRGWGRNIGIILGVLGGLLYLGGLASPSTPEVRQGMGGTLFLFAVHAYMVIALLFFWRTKPAQA